MGNEPGLAIVVTTGISASIAKRETASGSEQRSTPVPITITGPPGRAHGREERAEGALGGRRRPRQIGEIARQGGGAGPHLEVVHVPRDEQHAGPLPPLERGLHRRVEVRPERGGVVDPRDVLGHRAEERERVHRAPDPGRVLEPAAPVELRARLPDQGQHGHALRVRLGDADGEVHHPAARGGAADPERLVDARPRVGHERRADLGLGEHGGEPALPEPVDGVVEVLDVGAADAEDEPEVPVAQRDGEGVYELHDQEGSAGARGLGPLAAPSRGACQWTTAAAA